MLCRADIAKRGRHGQPATRNGARRRARALRELGRANATARNGHGGDHIVGNGICSRDNLDADHLRGLYNDIGAHLSGADEAHAHRVAVALAPLERLGQRAAGLLR